MTARSVVARPASGARYAHGEGLRWDAGRAELLWVDITAGRFLRAAPHALDQAVVHQLDVPVGVVAPVETGGWVAGAGRGFQRVGEDGAVERWPDVEPEGVRMNDGACDALGQFWVGSMSDDERPGAGRLHVLGQDGSVRTVLAGLTISNGLGWSPDGSRMYLNDSGAGVTYAFDVEPATGRPVTRQVLVRHERGVGDGLAVDDEGFVWTALWGGHGVHRYDPDGRLVARVDVDATNVTSCCLVDGTLFVTTATKGLAHVGPGDGRLHAADVGVGAPPVRAWRPC